jgi:hypothetical protein
LVYGGVAVDRGRGDVCGVGTVFEPEANGRVLCGSPWASKLPGLRGAERLFVAAGVILETVFKEKGNLWRIDDNTAKRSLTVPPLLV